MFHCGNDGNCLFENFPVDSSIWLDVIALYPSLVACVTSTSLQVSAALREALHEYSDLLQSPEKK